MKVFKKILSIFGWIVFGFVLLVGIWNCADKFSGYKCPPFGTRMSSIGSSSMEIIYPGRLLPEDTYRIKKGDIIVTSSVSKYEDLNEYDVITYYDGTYLICHRIIELYSADGKNYIVAQGDANNTPDKPIEFSLVRGKVTKIMTGGLADFLVFMQSGWGLMAVFFSAGFICLGIFIYSNVSKKDKNQVTDFNNNDNKKVKDGKIQEVSVKEKPVQQPKPVVAPKVEQPKPIEQPKPVVAPKVEQPKHVEQPKPEPKVEPVKELDQAAEVKPVQPVLDEQPRVNGRFVSKTKPQSVTASQSKSTRWTKENNPFANKKRAEGGDK